MSAIFGLIHLDQSQIRRDWAIKSEGQLSHRGDKLESFDELDWMHLSWRGAPNSALKAGFVTREDQFALFEGLSFSDPEGLPLDKGLDEFLVNDGELALALVDKSSARVTLYCDPIGARQIYYYFKNNILVFASEIKALVSHPLVWARPNFLGLSSYVLGELSLADVVDTGFENIFVVAPGHKLTFNCDKKEVMSRYFDFNVNKSLEIKNFGEACEQFRHLFLRSVRRRLPSYAKSGVSVSGGLDSSAILCSALHLGLDVKGVSYVSESVEADETHYLNEIEKKFDFSIHRFPVAPEQEVAKGLRDQLNACEAPMVDYLWQGTMRLHEQAKDLGIEHLLSGHWGDQVLFNSEYLVDELKRGEWLLATRHLGEFGFWTYKDYPRFLLRKLPRSYFKAILPATLLEILGKFKRKHRVSGDLFFWPQAREFHLTTLNETQFGSWQMRAMYKTIRSKHFFHSMQWSNKVGAQSGLSLSFPMIDKDLLEFLIRLPGRLQNHQGVPRAILRESLRGILPDLICSRKWKADFTELIHTSIQSELELVLPRLKSGEIVKAGLVRSQEKWLKKIDELKASISPNSCSAAWQIYDYLALDLFLEVQSGYNLDKKTGGEMAGAEVKDKTIKSVYKKPELKKIGRLESLTQDKGGSKSDGGGKPSSRLSGTPG